MGKTTKSVHMNSHIEGGGGGRGGVLLEGTFWGFSGGGGVRGGKLGGFGGGSLYIVVFVLYIHCIF